MRTNLKINRVLVRFGAAFGAALVYVSVAMSVQAQQSETTANCDEGAIAEPVALTFGDATSGCAIDNSATDTDRFVFDAQADDTIRVTLVGLANNLDPLIELRDATNTLLETASCVSASNTRCSLRLDATLASSGQYLLLLLEQGADTTGGYVLVIERIAPDTSATILAYDAEATDSLGGLGDTDVFSLPVSNGAQLTFNLVTLNNNLDPRVEVRDSDGNLLINGTADGAGCNSASNTRCSLRFDVDAAADDTLSVHVYDEDGFNTGDYQLAVWCRFGPCPGNPVPDAAGPQLDYDVVLSDAISGLADADDLRFEANANTALRINVVTMTNNLDPRIVVRGPAGSVVVAQTGCNSASNTRCSFSVDLAPALSGTYVLQIFDEDSFNTGSYRISLWCEFGDCPGQTVPDPNGDPLLYVPTTPRTIDLEIERTTLAFNAAAGNQLRLVVATLTNNLDPRVEVRDPLGNVVIDGLADGAGCNSASNTRCSFQVDFVPGSTGLYALQLFDEDGFNAGSVEFALWCLRGDCDSDGDGFIDGDREVMTYGEVIADNVIDSLGDADHYLFQGTPGDEIRLTVAGQSVNLDPRILVLDPNGDPVLDGSGSTGCNSSSNTVCSFAYTLMPALSGAYSVILYDDDAFNTGDYDIALECLFGTGPGFTCTDLAPPPAVCIDNCSSVGNPDQRDTNEDGFGNVCDADLNGDLIVNVTDLGLLRTVFFTADSDGDFNGDGIVNVIDLGILRQAFFDPPGPSCAAPNLP